MIGQIVIQRAAVEVAASSSTASSPRRWTTSTAPSWRELQADGRLSVNELAGRVNVAGPPPTSACNGCEDDGVITGFAAVVDPARVGLGIAALILVNVDQGDWRDARRELLDLPGVQYLAFDQRHLRFRRAGARARRGDPPRRRPGELHGPPEVRSTQTVFVLEDHMPLQVVPPSGPSARA